MTNAISTIAVSSPLIAFLFRASLAKVRSQRVKIDCPFRITLQNPLREYSGTRVTFDRTPLAVDLRLCKEMNDGTNIRNESVLHELRFGYCRETQPCDTR
jgi:hypothetical protein